jgi:uncharacterized membrane protein YeaQ/YmgE (transglycosylase-associated protein family)
VGLIGYLVALAVTGLVVGALARLALPGPDPMGCGMTMLVGIAGSLAAGMFARLVFGARAGGGIILAILFATLFVYLIRRSRGGTVTRPAPPGRFGRRY